MHRLITALLVLGVVTAAAIHKPHATASDDPTADDWRGARRNPEGQPRPKFTPGKETTYVTGPLDADGRIDYAFALNEHLSRGVTPASNATVLLWKAFGPHPEGVTMPPVFYQWLGIKAPPDRGDYYLDLGKYARERLGAAAQADFDALYEQIDRASQAPWTAKQYPAIAGWLKANEKSLALVIEATKRPHYFFPLVPYPSGSKTPTLVYASLAGVQRCRELAMILPARAMLRAGEGRHAEAWDNLLALHRLSRLLTHGGTMIEGLVGYAIESIASGASLAYLGRGRLSTQQIKDCLRDLRRLPPMSCMADKIALTERLVFLDAVMAAERDGLESLNGLIQQQALALPADAQARSILKDIDWDTVLRTVNRRHDRLVAALRSKDRGLRNARLNRIEQEFTKRKQELTAAGGLGKAMLAARNAKARGRLLGNVLTSWVIPGTRKVQQAAERTEQLQRNLLVGFALAAYQRKHGRYPTKLEALAPAYLPQVPGDLFSGKALIYHPVESAYLLYSVGVNGVDEQGRTYDDDPAGDDLRVRMPLLKLK